jgi:tRNA A37 threonylcarbamoyladenosine synthetase subunit TsaC/SUA5/YrdC
MPKAKLINLSDPEHYNIMAQILLDGGVVGAIWAHHLYFLAGNAFDKEAVKKINQIKGRPVDQVLASPGSVEEAEELADFKKCEGLLYAAKKMKMTPKQYLEFLFRKYPLAVELYSKDDAPTSITLATEKGRTIWIAAHMTDKSYANLLGSVRKLRRGGNSIFFAATSLNLTGENTLTVKDFDTVLAQFGQKLNAISIFPNSDKLKKLKYATSSSAVSFIYKRPKLIRIGATSITSLKKYIPDLETDSNVPTTRKTTN